MDEPTLISQAQAGDVHAYNTLVLHYQEQVYSVAYRIMGEPGAAADATQEAFIAAYKSLRSFRGGSFKSWLLRIVTNACYDELRRLRTGEARIAVGPRSAVFAPVAELGLIVVDEEHDASYKQDGDPRYDARHVAAYRAYLVARYELTDPGAPESALDDEQLREERARFVRRYQEPEAAAGFREQCARVLRSTAA